jgi:hypothetical protein
MRVAAEAATAAVMLVVARGRGVLEWGRLKKSTNFDGP